MSCLGSKLKKPKNPIPLPIYENCGDDIISEPNEHKRNDTEICGYKPVSLCLKI